jgi:phospholipid/cholesterol/gamma-HCH transport system substrate-binding protein
VRKSSTELLVGLFVLASIGAFVFMALKVSGLLWSPNQQHYQVTAYFENVGDLKVRAPVTMSGVKIGQVSDIRLDTKSLEAQVTLDIQSQYDHIVAPNASANIYTAGLLGANYIALFPGYAELDMDETETPVMLQQGSQIRNTQSAVVLENLISHFIYGLKDKS